MIPKRWLHYKRVAENIYDEVYDFPETNEEGASAANTSGAIYVDFDH